MKTKTLQMKILLFVCALFYSFSTDLYANEKGSYLPIGKSFAYEVWGVRKVDIEGDGKGKVYFIDRRKLYVMKGNDVSEVYDFGHFARNFAISACDLNRTGKDVIVISSMGNYNFVSYVVSFDGRLSVSNFPMQMRLYETASGCKLLGKRTEKIDIYEIESGKLNKVGRFPRIGINSLYGFSELPGGEIVRLNSDGKLELWEQQGKSYKKVWGGGIFFGRSMNLIELEKFEQFEFIQSPVVIDSSTIALIQYKQPIRQVVGKRPYTEGSRIVILKRQNDLGFIEDNSLGWLSAIITDYFLDKGKSVSAKGIIYSLQFGLNLFTEGKKGSIARWEY